MKTQVKTNLLLRGSLALALAVAVGHPTPMQSAEPAEGKQMMEHCQAMKEQKEKVAADMKVQDTELAAQVAQMNQAPADKKLGLLGAVVTRMVEQRTAMHAQMAKAQEGMMRHMMEHMQIGKASMAQCPMMKEMNAAPAAAHKAHQAGQK